MITLRLPKLNLYILTFVQIQTKGQPILNNLCPRGLVPFYEVNCYIEINKTFWQQNIKFLGKYSKYAFWDITICPGSSDPFHIVSYYIVTTSWTYSISLFLLIVLFYK